uniref:protein LONGIFOLIA 1-like n=1 Tax=Erigeron canadensis TaxID=72917 RepID=UPI001CB8953D|nr:protein LONGIFOLIA 1-like [Erigeron canadensis]
MAAKYLHSLADENQDLQKQLGCMTGVFHIFNRNNIVSGRRAIGPSPKKGLHGSSLFNNRTPDRESSVIYHRSPILERHRVSTESSKVSFSSSSPPSPFPYENYKIDTGTRQEREESNSSGKMNPQNLDLRDVVKDSMHREARGLSHKTIMKESDEWYFDEPRELSRSKSCHINDVLPISVSKDYPRFSYDGRESDRLSNKSDSKTTSSKKLKEPPRLSLDSRERSIRTLSFISLVPIKSPESKSNLSRNPVGIDDQKDLTRTRPPSVVAKLMGLETYPNSASNSNKELVVDPNSLSKGSSVPDFCGSTTKMSNSTRTSLREPTSPCWKNSDMKPISRVPIEAAPWKQRDGARAIASSTKIQIPTSSVYSEVDKRLKNLEFAQSGKDLRALKQILEAMQAVEARKEERQETAETSLEHNHRNVPSDVSKAHGSHIVIMKPTKLVGKGFANNKTGKDVITERRSRLATSYIDSATSYTDSSKPRKQSNKHHSESKLTRRRKQPSNIQQSDRIMRKVDDGRALKMDTAVNASESSEETNSRQSSSSTPEKSTLLVKIGEPLTPEYPSPVSVLDDSVYMEKSPSPVKPTPNHQKDNVTQNPADIIVKDGYKATNNVLPNRIISGVSSQIDNERLKKVQDLVQKLKRLNTNDDETHTNHIAFLCENTNSTDKYISEILLASGLLLRDLESFKFHSSSHPINPELFLVMEHIKFSNLQQGKFHRKLIFDAVNESLVGKLSSPSKLMQNPRKLLKEICLEIEQLHGCTKRESSGLEEEGDDLIKILSEDVLKNSDIWTGVYGESSAISVEVERLIFRDLVYELVMSEAYDGKLGMPGIFC